MEEEHEWGMSDHCLIWGRFKAAVQRDRVRKVVDWEKLTGIIKGVKEAGIEKENDWYKNLPGRSYYDKMVSLRARCLKDSQQGKWAKRW